MSNLAKFGWILAAFTLIGVGFLSAFNASPDWHDYTIGAVLGWQWAWTLKGVK